MNLIGSSKAHLRSIQNRVSYFKFNEVFALLVKHECKMPILTLMKNTSLFSITASTQYFSVIYCLL